LNTPGFGETVNEYERVNIRAKKGKLLCDIGDDFCREQTRYCPFNKGKTEE
jgi:hypothetical protein